MKNLVNAMLTVGIALTAVVTANAQSKAIKADVPFNFYVGPTVMPQGAYRVDDLNNGAVVSIRSLDNDVAKAITAMNVIGKSNEEAPRMVFYRYGNTYFLRQVWTGGSPNGQAIGSSKREKELARTSPAPTLAVIRLAVR